jgi:exopolysaccharide production protein ExoZ
MVVVFHSTSIWSNKLASGNSRLCWDNGAAGVDLFFVISGFVMALSCLDRPDLSAMSFMWNRIVRIVPMYWIVTAIVVAKSPYQNKAYKTGFLSYKIFYLGDSV